MSITSLDKHCQLLTAKLIYRDFRIGDVCHSLANISNAQTLLGYAPAVKIIVGFMKAMPWYISMIGDG
jgi:UDP-N-acetylglucosamine 4-epimerase